MRATSCPACAATRHRRSYLYQGRFEGFSFDYLSCEACGTISVSPMPDDRVLDELYSPKYLADHYSGAVDPEIESEAQDVAARIASMRSGGRALDVGCGAGAFLRKLSGLGLVAEGYERVSTTAASVSASTRLPVHAGALSSLAGGYDVIHLSDVLEHLVDPLPMLLDARKLLATGGLLVARGPLEANATLFERSIRLRRRVAARLGRDMTTSLPPWHVVLFTYAGWHALLDRAGFRVAEERLSEIHWPVSLDAPLGVASILKRASLTLSSSRLGALGHLGNRVVSFTTVA